MERLADQVSLGRGVAPVSSARGVNWDIIMSVARTSMGLRCPWCGWRVSASIVWEGGDFLLTLQGSGVRSSAGKDKQSNLSGVLTESRDDENVIGLLIRVNSRSFRPKNWGVYRRCRPVEEALL